MDTVELHPNHLTMKQSSDMQVFHLTEWKLRFNSPCEVLKMSISMQRKITSEVMTTYFPSLLLIAITFATTFFKPFFFEAALSVNLTTMLVMTTIFISKMESLPPTSDIKMIDIRLILCQLVPFAEVVLLTAMEYQRPDKTEQKAKQKRRKKKTKKKIISSAVSIHIIPSHSDNSADRVTRMMKWCKDTVTKYHPGLKTLGELGISFDSLILNHPFKV